MRSPIPRTILAVSLSAAEGSEAALEILRSGKPRRLSPHEGMTFGTPAGRKLSVASADPIGRPACQGNVPVARRPTKANMTGRIRGIREVQQGSVQSGWRSFQAVRHASKARAASIRKSRRSPMPQARAPQEGP